MDTEVQQHKREVTNEEVHIAALDYSKRKVITYEQAVEIIIDCVWHEEDGNSYMVRK
tara:strand:- start:1048 stop:1218 length:171 start_codon:yes stop_codon:yes gene_type:complete